MNPNKTEIVVLVDRSGSMTELVKDMEAGYAAFVKDQETVAGEAALTLVTFDTQGLDTIYESAPLASARTFTLKPRGGTPLIDAVAMTIDKVGARLDKLPEAEKPASVFFMIITDGEENSSKHFKKTDVQERIKRQTEQYNWHFIYLGANVDAFNEAASLGISTYNAANYTPSAVGVRSAYEASSSTARSLREQGTAQGFTDDQRKSLVTP